MKKQFKTLLVIIAALLITGACFAGMALAENDPTIAVSEVVGKPGDTITVDVSLRNNPGIVMAKIAIAYDSDIMELVSTKNGVVFVGDGVIAVNSPAITANPYSMSWTSTSTTDHTDDGVLTQLTFMIKDDAMVGASSAVTVSYEAKNIVNVNLEQVAFALEQGSVTVTDEYTVTYVDGLTDEVISTEVVTHGDDATLPTPPTHEGYDFTGWSSDGLSITADTTITAQYTIKTYTVTYVDSHTGEAISTELVNHGENATLPTPPTHEGYDFVNWSSDGICITDDTTITAQYTKKSYIVSFVDWDGELLDSQMVFHGENAIAPTDPVREGYTFIGWDIDFTNVTADISVTAQYEIMIYTVTFVDGLTEEVLSTTTVEHGGSVTLPTPPTHELYNFTGWTSDGTNITADTTITAQYAIFSYTVTFVNWDGSVIETQTVNHGEAAIAPADPVREGYDFTGWDKAFDNITADLFVTAQYTIKTYTVSFVDYDSTILKTETVNHGEAATAPTDPVRVGYNFTGWDIAFSNVTSDLTVTAQYAIITYTVTFVDHDGTVLKTETVNHGEDATAPADPVRVGYNFTGWDIAFDNVTSNLTVTAQYAIKSYTVTFVDYDGTVLKTETVNHGEDATAPADPVREGYDFIGWDIAFDNVTSDLTVTAQYEMAILIGDVNEDGTINTGDAVTVLRYSVGLIQLSDSQMIAADYNNDTKVNTGDAVGILRYCVGLKCESAMVFDAICKND